MGIKYIFLEFSYIYRYKLLDMYESIHKFVLVGLRKDTQCDKCVSEWQICVFQDEIIIDPFAMPSWRKLAWSIFFFLMVAAADIGNIIGNYQYKERDGRTFTTNKYWWYYHHLIFSCYGTTFISLITFKIQNILCINTSIKSY